MSEDLNKELQLGINQTKDSVLSSIYGIASVADGMGQPPDTAQTSSKSRMLERIDSLFITGSSEDYLSPGELERLKLFVVEVGQKLDGFAAKYLRRDFDVSHQVPPPLNDFESGEICRFLPADKSNTPSALVFLDGGELKFRYGPKPMEGRIFDIFAKPITGMEIGSLGKVSEVDSGLVKKLGRIISGDAFKDRWRSLQERTLTYPRADIERIVRKAFELPGNDPEKGIFPISLADDLRQVRQVLVRRSEWRDLDKSFGFITKINNVDKTLVFGYVDGKGVFIKPDSKQNIFDVLDDTGNVEVLYIKPRSVPTKS